jgi:formamidopyrimidine-DNA glycosylase
VLVLGPGEEATHPLLAHIGPEPLGDQFSVATLVAACRTRSTTIKQTIMDGEVVVGVGTSMRPKPCSAPAFARARAPRGSAGRASPASPRQSARCSPRRSNKVAPRCGFVNSNGNPGYFRQRLFVYDRGGEPCRVCATPICRAVVGQRSTFWCPNCQS